MYVYPKEPVRRKGRRSGRSFPFRQARRRRNRIRCLLLSRPVGRNVPHLGQNSAHDHRCDRRSRNHFMARVQKERS